jgi:hypothetical protein
MDMAIAETSGARSLSQRIAGLGLESVSDLKSRASILENRRAGQIVVERGRLVAVHGRWWPYLGDHCQIIIDRLWPSKLVDRCELFYHVSLAAPQFLTLSYIRSTKATNLATVYAATLVLDEIARRKGALAIVCNVANPRISDRILTRWGWQRQLS